VEQIITNFSVTLNIRSSLGIAPPASTLLTSNLNFKLSYQSPIDSIPPTMIEQVEWRYGVFRGPVVLSFNVSKDRSALDLLMNFTLNKPLFPGQANLTWRLPNISSRKWEYLNTSTLQEQPRKATLHELYTVENEEIKDKLAPEEHVLYPSRLNDSDLSGCMLEEFNSTFVMTCKNKTLVNQSILNCSANVSSCIEVVTSSLVEKFKVRYIQKLNPRLEIPVPVYDEREMQLFDSTWAQQHVCTCRPSNLDF